MGITIDIGVNINCCQPLNDLLPLDQIDGTGNMPAVSMRRIRSGYTGSCLRVQRASDLAEQDIGFLGTGWRDDVALAAFCSGTEGYIVKWYNQDSGSGPDLVQTTANACPRVYFNATGVVTDPVTGNPSAAFGINTVNPQRLESESAVTDGKEKAFFAVAGTSSPPSERHAIWGNDDGAAQYHITLARKADGYLELADSANGNARTADGTFAQDSFHAWGYSGPTTGLIMSIDGVALTWNTAPSDTSWGTGVKLYLGDDNWGLTSSMEGYISEALCIHGSTTTDLATDITAEQKAAFGI